MNNPFRRINTAHNIEKIKSILDVDQQWAMLYEERQEIVE